MEALLSVVVVLLALLYVVVALQYFYRREDTWKRPFRSLESDFAELDERVAHALGRISRLKGLATRGTTSSMQPGDGGNGTTVSVPAPAASPTPRLRSKLYAEHLKTRKLNAFSNRSGTGESR